MNKDFNIVFNKLETFKKKYYLFHIIRGILLISLIFIILFVILSFIEYQLFMSSSIRRIIFLSFSLFLILIIINFVVLPILKYLGWIKTGNKGKVTSIIQNYFKEIKDKLINVIELQNISDDNYSLSIINAAISQKSADLKLFDFKEAINLKNIRKLGLYLVLSFLVVGVIYWTDKPVITESGNRIIHYNQEFIKPFPFQFRLMNKELSVKKGNDFKILLSCVGKDIPSVVYVNIDGNNFLMKSTEMNSFEYEVSSVINKVEFYFTDLKYSSKMYSLKVISVPLINSFSVDITPPNYTNLKSQQLENIGDFKIPCGSEVIWNFKCFDTDSLIIKYKDGILVHSNYENRNIFTVKSFLLKPVVYDIMVKNKETGFEPVMNFTIDIKEDLYPEIEVSQIPDSTKLTRFFFKGNIRDDYGFTNLSFHIVSDNMDSVISLPVIKNLNDQNFYYSSDLKDFKIKGKTVSYYFSVSDNDEINHPKTTVSESYSFTFPDENEIYEKQKDDFEHIEQLIKESHQITEDLKKEIKDLQIKNINNSSTDWEKSQQVNDIISKKENLENIIDQIQKMNQLSNDYRNTFNEQSQEILKKQQEIQDLLKDVMTDELKKLLEEFSKLAEKFNSEKFNEMNDKMNLSLDDLSKQLDRNLEMLKKMKIEQNIEEQIKKLGEIKEREEKGANDILNDKDFEKSKDELENDLKQTKEAEKKIHEINDENNELKKPLIFDNFSKEFSDIKDNMSDTGKELDRKNKKSASKSMGETAQKLNNLLFSMRQMLNSNKSQQNGEDIMTLKRILKNILYLSLNQENILNSTTNTTENDPVLRNLKRNQKTLIEQSQVIKDSLYALANRSPKIGSIVNEDIVSLEINLIDAIKLMEDGSYPQAAVKQRVVMTAANNLTLFLSEILQQIEFQEAAADSDSENCRNGKGSKMSLFKKEAGSLQQQLQDMIEKLKKNEGKNLSHELSESLMRHELMQKMLRDMMNSGSIGNDTRQQLRQIDQLLEQNRKDIMNKRITPITIQRHNEIMSRLLDAEKSENERDLDNKRESNTADKKFYSNPAKYFEKKEIKNTTLEYLQRKDLKLTDFYNEKQRIYLEKCNSHNTK